MKFRCGEVMTEATLKELGEANWKARLAAMEEVGFSNSNFSMLIFSPGELEIVWDG